MGKNKHKAEAASAPPPAPLQAGPPPAIKEKAAWRPSPASMIPFRIVVGMITVLLAGYLFMRFTDPREWVRRQRVWWTLALVLVLAGCLIRALQLLQTLDPGFIHPDDPVWGGANADFSRHVTRERKANGQRRYCVKTGVFKPDRAHLCHVSGRVVRRLDHHCIFLNAVVGHNNHKLFVNLLWYAAALGGVMALETFHSAHGAFIAGIQAASPRWGWAYTTGTFTVFVICTALSFSLAGFAAFHTYLIRRGTTTIEFSEKTGVILADGSCHARSPYEAPSFFDAMAEVYGREKVWTWPLPTPPTGHGDGVQWAARPDMWHPQKHAGEYADGCVLPRR